MEPLRVNIPTFKHSASEGGIEIKLYTPKDSPIQAPVYEREKLLSRCLSLRNVFALLSLVIVSTISISLIFLFYTGQWRTLETQIKDRMLLRNNVTRYIVSEQFQWTRDQFEISKYFFSNLTVPPNTSKNLILEWPYVSELFFGITRTRTFGVEVGFHFPDGRAFGFTAIDNVTEAFMIYNETGTLKFYFWKLNQTTPITAAEIYSREADNQIGDSSLAYADVDYSLPCDYFRWTGIYAEKRNTSVVSLYGGYGPRCNGQGEMLGYLYVSISTDSTNSILAFLSALYKQRMFIVNSKAQLISSYSYTPIINETTLELISVYEIKEQWIIDVVKKLPKNLNATKSFSYVTINSTVYILSVDRWKNSYFELYVISLIEYEHFLAPIYSDIKKSVFTSVGIAIASVVVALAVTYFATRSLSSLAHHMQKMARLDFDNTDEVENSKLIELKRLYHAYMGMRVALKSFKKFVPVQIIEKIIRSKKEVAAELKFRDLTVMFQDIEGFTTLSETMEPSKLAKLTSEYMNVMTTIICNHGGTIDKYVGDCIMSLFNAPEAIDNHPVAAAQAAVECLIAVQNKNKEWMQKYGAEMNFRIGIHTGEVLVGNMGSANRMNYTAFGDNVNIAARLEGVNKLFGTRIVVSRRVYKHFPPGQFVARKLGKVKVSGKSIATTIYEVRGEETLNTIELFRIYEKALSACKESDFTNANVYVEEALRCCPTDKATLHLKERLEDLDNWTYVEDLVKY